MGGRVLVLDGSSGELVHLITCPDLTFYGAVLTLLGDLNGDGHSEFAFRADYPKSIWWRHGRGVVFVVDGSSFEILRRHEGIDQSFSNDDGDRLGSALASVGDIDLDGVADYLLGTERDASPLDSGLIGMGKLYLHSGSTGKVLAAYQSPFGTDAFFTKLSALGDVDHDGRPEFLVGSYSHGEPHRSGQVRLVRYDPAWPTFLRGDGDGNGVVELADAVFILLYLFAGSPSGGCLQALDVNASSSITGSDAVHILRHIYDGRLAPAAPFPECARFGGFLVEDLSCDESR